MKPAPERTPGFLDRKGPVALFVGLIALVAFALRVVYVLQTRASPLFDAPQMDAAYHVDWARAFARGEDFQPGPFFRAPLYPWFLGLCFRWFGDGLLAPRLLQAGFGAATAVLTYAIGARAFERRTGLVAGFGAATTWMLVFYDGELLLESLSIPLNLLAVWLALGLAERASGPRAALAGAAFGLAAIARPNVLLVVPLIALWLAWWQHRRGASGWKAPLALALGTLAPIAPISAYNGFAGKDAVLISTQAGVNLWIGNNPQSNGSTAWVPGTREDWWGGFHDAIAQAEHAEGRALKPSEVSSHYTRKALEFWCSDPLAALRLTGWKLRLLWTDWELGNNEEPRFFAHRFGPITRALPLGFGAIGAFGLLGFLVSLRGGGRRAPLALFSIGYAASVVAFFVCSRFRAPLLPVLLVYAAHALFWIAAAVRARRWGALGGASAVLALSALVSWTPPRGLVDPEANGLYLLATVAQQRGENERAAELLSRSLEVAPGVYVAQRQHARVLRELARKDEAAQAYRRALALQPADVSSLDELGDLLLAEGEHEEAARLAEQATAAAPHDPRGPYLLGRVRLDEKRLDEAEQAFERSLAIDPSSFRSAYALASVHFARGAVDAGLAALERAARMTPQPGDESFARTAWLMLVEAHERQGQRREALARAREALQRFPGDADLLALEQRLAAGGE